MSLSTFVAPQKYRLMLGLAGMESVENDWDFWVYPARLPAGTPADVLVTRSFAEAEKKLAAGGKVLFLPPYHQLNWTARLWGGCDFLESADGAWLGPLPGPSVRPESSGLPSSRRTSITTGKGGCDAAGVPGDESGPAEPRSATDRPGDR
jgi:hypothetical protein